MTIKMKELLSEYSLESEVTNIDTTGAIPVESQSNAVTYDEGKGKKDVIVMDGPLSEIYTRGLNLYFAKGNPEEGPEIASADEQSVSENSVAAESAQIQETMTNSALAHLATGSIDFEIVADTADLEESPTVNIAVVPQDEALMPETITRVEEDSKRSIDYGKDYVLAVVPPSGNYAGVNPSQFSSDTYIDLKPDSNRSDLETFKAATESFYSKRGVKVVFGAEGIANWISNRVSLANKQTK